MGTKRKSPGMNFEERRGSVSTIRGADLGTVFVQGIAEWGEIAKPITILNPKDAQAKIGGYLDGYYGRKEVDLAFDHGAARVVFVRTAHYTAGVLDAAKAALTLQGYDPETEDQAKVNTLKLEATGEGTFGNKLNVTTQKASGGPLLAIFATGDEKIECTSVTGFEIGDIVEVADTVVHYVRVVVTKIDTANKYLYCKAQALAVGIQVANSTVKTASTHSVRTTIATGESLATDDTTLKLTSASGVKIGTILTVVDKRIAGGQPNQVTMKVTSISQNTVSFASVGAITTIAAADSEVVSQEFDLTVFLETEQLETQQEYLCMQDNNSEHYVENDENFKSAYVVATDEDSAEGLLGQIPIAVENEYLTAGADGLSSLADADFTGSEANRTGFHAFSKEPKQFAQILCADARSTAVTNAMLRYAEDRELWTVTDEPFDKTYAEAIAQVVATGMYNSENGEIEWPHVKWLNPITGITEVIPASGAVAGNNAKTWTADGKGPWEQPAGVERGILGHIQGLETDVAKDEDIRNELYPNRINPIYPYPPYGYVVYGIRTLAVNGIFSQKGERITSLYIIHSIRAGVPWTVFSNIDDALENRADRTIRKFLRGIRLAGGLKGATDEEAFVIDFVSSNTEETEELGEWYVDIGCAYKKAGEFAYFRISKKSVAA